MFWQGPTEKILEKTLNLLCWSFYKFANDLNKFLYLIVVQSKVINDYFEPIISSRFQMEAGGRLKGMG